MNELGKILRELRVARNLSQREAARRLGISHSRLRDYEQGVTRGTNRAAIPNPDLLDKISERYQYPAPSLYALAGCSYLLESAPALPNGDALALAEISSILGQLSDDDRELLMDLVRCFGRRRGQEKNL